MSDDFDDDWPPARVRSFHASYWWMAFYIIVVTNVIAVPLAVGLVLWSGAPILTIQLLIAIAGGVAAWRRASF